MKSEVFNIDCMIGMKEYLDNYFDLAVVDPPYGIKTSFRSNLGSPAPFRGKKNNPIDKNVIKPKNYGIKKWDESSPNKDYFTELKRVSKNQIMWGANHYINKNPIGSSCWLVWDKKTNADYADAELAWTSFKTAVRIFEWRWSGLMQQDMKNKEHRIHPTQKPVGLYEWIFKNYAEEGHKILDTHLGSGSSRIAAYNYKMDFTGYEIDKDYFEAQEKRFKAHVSTNILKDNIWKDAELKTNQKEIF